MKKLFILYIIGIFTSCNNITPTVSYEDDKTTCVIDSVEYHPIGYDHTLQTTPYWVIFIKNGKNKFTSRKFYQKGDTIQVIERKIKK